MQVPQVYRILPELWLTITGVLIMLIEPLMPPGMTRKPIGVLALVGVIGSFAGQRLANWDCRRERLSMARCRPTPSASFSTS